MPQRTNDFQKLITQIYKQMADPDDVVIESAIVNEPGSGTPREIDILLQKKIFGTPISIAVECRDRGRKGDVEWIDGLIGKYRDLRINKIIAVSKSGFTKAAQVKAHSNGIDTLTLVEALETDWPSEFKRLGFAKIVRDDRPHRVEVFTEDTFSGALYLSAPLFSDVGEQLGTVEEVARLIYEGNRENITKAIGKQFLSLFKTLEDIRKHSVLVGIPFTPPNPVFIEDNDKRLRVIQIIVEMSCVYSYEPSSAFHHILGGKQITQTTITDAQSNAITITAIQEADKPNQANIRVEKVDNSSLDKLVPKKSKKSKKP